MRRKKNYLIRFSWKVRECTGLFFLLPLVRLFSSPFFFVRSFSSLSLPSFSGFLSMASHGEEDGCEIEVAAGDSHPGCLIERERAEEDRRMG